MLNNLLEKKSDFDLSLKSSFSTDINSFSSSSYSALLAKNGVPHNFKKIADNYIIIKRIFKFQVAGKISNVEKNLLKQYNFESLELINAKKMYEELVLLQMWSNNDELKEIAEKIFLIRIKELKYISSSNYTVLSNEIYNGYAALERYLQEISHY